MSLSQKQKRALRKGWLMLKRAGPSLRKRWAVKAALTRCKKREAAASSMVTANPEVKIDKLPPSARFVYGGRRYIKVPDRTEYGDFIAMDQVSRQDVRFGPGTHVESIDFKKNPDPEEKLGPMHMSLCRDFKNPVDTSYEGSWADEMARGYSRPRDWVAETLTMPMILQNENIRMEVQRRLGNAGYSREDAQRVYREVKDELNAARGQVVAHEYVKRYGPSRNPWLGSATHNIEHGDRVTIVNRFGQKSTGRAVMRGPHGWVLNMGGRYGTPAIADGSNIVKVSKAKKNPTEETMSYRSALNPELLLIGAGNPKGKKKRSRRRHKARNIRFRRKLVSRQKLIKLIGKIKAAKLWKKKCKKYRRGCKKLGMRGKKR